MTDYLKLELHTFENSRAIDLTPFVERVNWRESVTRPWDSITATFALPLAQIFRTESRESTQSRASNQLGALEPRPPEYADNVTRISLLAQDERLALPMGSWLKLVDEKGLCKAFGRVPDRTIEYMAGEAGLRDSTAQLSAESWLEFLNSIDAQVFAELNDTIGTLFGVATERWKDYSELVFKILNNPSPKLIVGAKGFLGIMASIQIPPTLFQGKSTLAELIDIAYNADTGNRLCPNRTMDEVPVFPVSSIQSIQPSGKVPDLLFSVWQPEPRLVELFPSIEKGLPILIHRFAPWRKDSLAEVVVASGGNAPKLTNPLWRRKTWTLEKKLYIEANKGFRIASSQSDTNRVNAVTLRWNVAGPSTVRTLADLGLPLYDRDDVEKNGTRMFEFNWSIGAGYAANPLTSGVSGPQTYQDAASATSGGAIRRSGLGIAGSGLGGFTSGELLRGLAVMAWQFYGLGHVFESGTIEGEFLDTELAKAGEPFSFDYGGPIPFAGYISAIEHSVTVRDGGVTEATSTISFTRGLWDENARGATLQVEAVDSPKVDESKPEEPVNPTTTISLALNTFSAVANLGPGWAEVCKEAKINGLAGRVIRQDTTANLAGFTQSSLQTLYVNCDQAGIRREGHGLQFCYTVPAAQTAGIVAAQVCADWQLIQYYANFDDDWYFNSTNHNDTAIAFIESFLARRSSLGISTELAWNGYVRDRGPSVNNQAIDIQRIVALCDSVYPMCYTYTASANRPFFMSRASRFNKPGGRGIMVGSGRIVPGKGVAGFYGGSDGYVSLFRELAQSNPLDRFCVWQNEASRIINPNASNPSLATAFAAILDPNLPVPE